MMLKPALKALLIQMLAVLISMLINALILTDAAFKIQHFLLLLASVSLILSIICKAAVWWHYIHFFFPLLVGILYYFQFQNWVYLVGFILSLGVFWTTYITQVPFYPSNAMVRQQVADLLTHEQKIKFIDIGSGIGDLCMSVALLKPHAEVTGIEIAPIPWLISLIRGCLKSTNAIFMLGNYNKLNFSDYDIIFAYLSPVAMSNLWNKAHSEMHSQSLLISYEFEVPKVQASRIIKAEGTSSLIYLYYI